MNKTTKNILFGICTCAVIIVILAVVRSLIKSVPIEEGFKDWSNWVIAAASGVACAWSSYNKDKEKEEKANKDRQ